MTTLALVQTPFQLLSAFEFEHFLKRSEFAHLLPLEVLAYESGSPENNRQLREVARRLDFPVTPLSTHDLPLILRGLASFRRVRPRVRMLAKTDAIAVGDPAFDLNGDALSRAACDHKWVLDDGTLSARCLATLDEREGKPPRVYATRPFRQRVRSVLLGGIRTPDLRQASWFTLFRRYFPDSPSIHENSMDRIRGLSPGGGQADEVLFLGGPLVERGILSDESYGSLCRKAAGWIREAYRGSKVVYMKHRMEERADAFPAEVFDEVVPSTQPIELRWIDGTPFPRAVVGLFSTALFSLAPVLRERSEITALWPDASTVFLERADHMEALRPLFEKAEALGVMKFRGL